jgi:GT2 family glycosyltransferase
MLRLSAVRAVGVYEPAPGGYGSEEKDLCIRLMEAGYRIMRLPGVHVWHDKTMMARDIAWQHKSGVCNDLAMVVRRAPAVLLPVLLPGKLFNHLKFSWRNRLLSPCLAGLALFARSLPAIVRLRKPVSLATFRAYLALNRTRAAG